MLDITVLTLFPDMFPGPLGHSLIGRALDNELWRLNTINIRDYGIGKHKQVDDTPYGGGAGLVMKPDVVDGAITAALEQQPSAQLVHFTPRGQRITQPLLQSLTERPLVMLCGRFEAIDERVIEKYQPLELSLGDFVMTGGELAAMAVIDATVRMLPGVIGEEGSLAEESFGLCKDYACLLEYPHYTKPPKWDGQNVPETLLSGHHGEIEKWRLAQAKAITKQRRPDLWEQYCAQATEDEG
ncbi:MAG: tRNA (guanosine(37)-N1)-methyltransferase TrmD [Rickettsiales bacterium]|nr:tRNA (guanosine(37)-N1)-methyltransferase TrmD [Rickettsiales bacterium]|tara:strand:+ start:31 stop:753 length:723 start_codon:yes stop_codon:yes gene_type:complete